MPGRRRRAHHALTQTPQTAPWSWTCSSTCSGGRSSKPGTTRATPTFTRCFCLLLLFLLILRILTAQAGTVTGQMTTPHCLSTPASAAPLPLSLQLTAAPPLPAHQVTSPLIRPMKVTPLPLGHPAGVAARHRKTNLS